MNARQRRYRQWKLLKALIAESIAIERTVGELTKLMVGRMAKAVTVPGRRTPRAQGQGTVTGFAEGAGIA